MKIAMVIVRTLMGLLFIFASVTFLLSLITPPPMEGPIKTFNEGLAASGYFFTLLKITELVCGLMLVSGFFVPLAQIILSPIIINILMVHLFLDRTGLPVAIFLVLANIFVAYYYRDAFKPLLTPSYQASR
ncbi:MAG TPA: DoxX family membrane protein [Pyrinomonadaceae bacterium]|nr:DoxX family membrane protein [Pyrinomonadaceae bacterium]